jgi:regulator of replication initiation timing
MQTGVMSRGTRVVPVENSEGKHRLTITLYLEGIHVCTVVNNYGSL